VGVTQGDSKHQQTTEHASVAPPWQPITSAPPKIFKCSESCVSRLQEAAQGGAGEAAAAAQVNQRVHQGRGCGGREGQEGPGEDQVGFLLVYLSRTPVHLGVARHVIAVRECAGGKIYWGSATTFLAMKQKIYVTPLHPRLATASVSRAQVSAFCCPSC